jgi:Fe-S-cluster containining protein
MDLEAFYQKIENLESDYKGECSHCGRCCQHPPLILHEEKKNIANYVAKHEIEANEESTGCIWLEDEKCKIYPARPGICRIFGYDPLLSCKFFEQFEKSPNWFWVRYVVSRTFYMQKISKESSEYIRQRKKSGWVSTGLREAQFKILPKGWWKWKKKT